MFLEGCTTLPFRPQVLHETHVAKELIGQTQVVVKRQEGDPLQPHHDDLQGSGQQGKVSKAGPG